MKPYFIIGIVCTVLQASYNLVDETGHSILFDVFGPLYGPVTWLATLVNMANVASVAYRLRKGMFILALRFITSIVWPIAIAWYVFDKLVTFKKEESANNRVEATK